MELRLKHCFNFNSKTTSRTFCIGNTSWRLQLRKRCIIKNKEIFAYFLAIICELQRKEYLINADILVFCKTADSEKKLIAQHQAAVFNREKLIVFDKRLDSTFLNPIVDTFYFGGDMSLNLEVIVRINDLRRILPQIVYQPNSPSNNYVQLTFRKHKSSVPYDLLTLHSSSFKETLKRLQKLNKPLEINLNCPKVLVDYHFQLFIHLIYMQDVNVIKHYNVRDVLELASKYRVTAVVDICEVFLSESEEVGKKIKIYLAFKYGLEKVKIHVLPKFSKNEIDVLLLDKDMQKLPIIEMRALQLALNTMFK